MNEYRPGYRDTPVLYVVLDNGGDKPGDDLGISIEGHPFVWTDGKIGLTEADADRAIAILNPSEE